MQNPSLTRSQSFRCAYPKQIALKNLVKRNRMAEETDCFRTRNSTRAPYTYVDSQAPTRDYTDTLFGPFALPYEEKTN